MSTSTLNLCINRPTPFEKRRRRPIIFIMSKPYELEKNIHLSRIGSRPRAFERAIDEVRTLSLTPPKGSSKSEFVVFVNNIQVQSNTATKFVCVKTSSGKFVVEPFPYLTVYRCWR